MPILTSGNELRMGHNLCYDQSWLIWWYY